jgi:c-di-GMP-binding flagellar brake protein YcgR
MHSERRKSYRIKPDSGFVCTLMSAEYEGHPGAAPNLATRLLDVSSGGACLVTVGRLRERVPLILDIHVPQALARFKARASVRWSETLERRGRTAHVAGLRIDRVLESYGDRLSFLGGRRDPAPPPPVEPQRRFKRFCPKDARVSCEPHGLARSLGIRREVALHLRDLSQGGAQVVCSRRLAPGRRVDLRLEVPAARTALSAEAQVRWCRRDTLSLESRWHAGLVFKRISPEDEERLKALDRFHLG